ncbi:hypothetical protein ACFC25_17020 [Pseudarthrobacter sp. NPDC055928]|uniref:hypothetical protein n=1 Tax=Pseudarthrobacter sp. NPDC055928 TaxID=3345661 RepID=UPI0035E27BF6
MERRRSAVVVEVHPQWGLPDLIAFQQEYAELAQVNHGQIGGRHQGAGSFEVDFGRCGRDRNVNGDPAAAVSHQVDVALGPFRRDCFEGDTGLRQRAADQAAVVVRPKRRAQAHTDA